MAFTPATIGTGKEVNADGAQLGRCEAFLLENLKVRGKYNKNIIKDMYIYKSINMRKK